MEKKKWKTKIKKSCIDAGTYMPYFDAVIDTLAGILEKRDEAAKELGKIGEDLVIEGASKNGITKLRNPLIVIWTDLNKAALAYWKDLGLTPAGLKKINEESFSKTKNEKHSLLDLLKAEEEKEEK